MDRNRRAAAPDAPWREPPLADADMRSHYVGAYGVFDYDQPVDPEESASPDDEGGRWLREPGQLPHDYDVPDAYQQFTGFNERVSRSGQGVAPRYRPVGPRGYQRSDARILEDICDRLTRSGRLDVRDVEVSVDGGVVTLEGSVPDRLQKYRVEDIVDDVFGVRDLLNRLRVSRGGPGQQGSSR
ncbi:BON domain-containing protein [Cupriavidus sp. WKF15]|uniref:BON domain-containing protein n=1 Tax=Cupriavidus sp. WKF15 TaxID=3032282 RepID=UPI0023E2236C|nr:BON domain-containing protein [Cupriavidus sp. WKF15]WER48518.1 BON domain-containing protein [Cupriavidus sp. WKF15]